MATFLYVKATFLSRIFFSGFFKLCIAFSGTICYNSFVIYGETKEVSKHEGEHSS